MRTRRDALLLSIVCLAVCVPQCTGQGVGKRVFTDMEGRNVTVPERITRVLGMSPVATILIYTLAPDRLAGWNYKQDLGEAEMVPEPYRSLPVLGGWYGKNNTGNLEEIAKARPDVLISMGDPLGMSAAERISEQTHIPVILLNGDLKSLPAAYLKAGELLYQPERARELAEVCRKAINEVEQKVNTIPLSKRRRVYYAEGPTGLETEPSNSMHSEALVFAGALNVAAVPNQQGYGHTPVSMEQVLVWDPEFVITGYDHTTSPSVFYAGVWKNRGWQQVRAVKTHNVYEVPQYPFCWIDRPPSVNRIIGIKWLANLFYPDIFRYDIREEARKFYATFYHFKLTDSQLTKLLATSIHSGQKAESWQGR